MSNETVLVTGGYGCIGGQTAKWLLARTDARVVVASRRVDEQRTERIFEGADRRRLLIESLDVVDQERIESLLAQWSVTRVIHLAALQTPDCNAHRDLGLQINLAGTQNMIEAIKTVGEQVRRFVFASSIAVYGPRESYPGDTVAMLSEPNPVNVYGTWKLAGELLTKLFHEETGIPAVSLRPGVLFGPGRDAGLTSTPTTAMKSVALGKAYQIPFTSRQDYLYAPDVGAAFGNAAMEPFEGVGVYTLPSESADTARIVDLMRVSAGKLGLESQFEVSVGDQEVPFISDLEYQPFLDAFPKSNQTPLAAAITESLSFFRDQVQKGWLTQA